MSDCLTCTCTQCAPHSTCVTSKVRPFSQGGDGGAIFSEDVHRSILHKVHVVPQCAVPHNEVSWEVDLKVELGDDGGDE